MMPGMCPSRRSKSRRARPARVDRAGPIDHENARNVVELRGWPGEDTLYMRTCPDCGFFEVSDDVELLGLYLECPNCDPAAAA
jgi:hypothetical protein